jgi:hypothetical protein
VFDVMVQGMESILLEGIDVYKTAGSQTNTAYTITDFPVSEVLTIEF